MMNLNSHSRLSIALTSLVLFAFLTNSLFGQCPLQCGTLNTIDHVGDLTNNADCGNNANGDCSVALGTNNTANGNYSFVMGNGNTADGLNSFVGGRNSSTDPTAEASIAYGDNVDVNRRYSVAMGYNLNQNGLGSFLLGGNFTNNVNNNFLVGWQSQSTATTAVLYADLSDPGGDGFLGINRMGTVNSSVNIDLSVNQYAEKGAGGTTWITPSDRRLKKDIEPFEDGLDILMEFEPVSFKYNGKLGTNKNQQEIGVIAQEVKEIAPYMIYGEETKDSYLSYSSNALFYILVNSVQEQQEKIKDYENRISELEQQMTEFKDATSSTTNTSNNGSDRTVKEVTLSNISIEEPMLFQNEPNPFSGSTTIRYFVPEEVSDAEIIVVSTESGQLLKRVAIDENGMGRLKLNIEKVAAGNYSYSLILDGEQALSKQMVVAH